MAGIKMNRSSGFSYQCNACGRCCHDKVITLSPHDVIRISRAQGISTGEAVRRYTLRRGSLLRFTAEGGCAALEGARCAIHCGRPLACRLYPLGLERTADDGDNFIRLEPAPGSLGVYGSRSALQEFLDVQGADEYLGMNAQYLALLSLLRDRLADSVDFETTEPREFWRRAVREALAESNYDPNPLIGAIFDPDGIGCFHASAAATVEAHLRAIELRIDSVSDPALIASAAVLLAVSLGYSPAAAQASP
jgi:Fe-S-cluster containining protein